MSRSAYVVHDRSLLRGLLRGEAGFHGPEVVLEGLTEEQAMAKPHGLPHSIADIVAHMWFYQAWFNRCAVEGFTTFPESAREGWPAVAAGEWESLRQKYLASIQQSLRIVTESDRLEQKLLPEGVPIPFLERETYGSGILHAAVHNGHHLGQVVMLRQLLGVWPPAAGSMTW